MTTPQRPIQSGFDETSTASAVLAGIDLSGKTAVVTGGYSGIGTETTRALRAAGARSQCIQVESSRISRAICLVMKCNKRAHSMHTANASST